MYLKAKLLTRAVYFHQHGFVACFRFPSECAPLVRAHAHACLGDKLQVASGKTEFMWSRYTTHYCCTALTALLNVRTICGQEIKRMRRPMAIYCDAYCLSSARVQRVTENVILHTFIKCITAQIKKWRFKGEQTLTGMWPKNFISSFISVRYYTKNMEVPLSSLTNISQERDPTDPLNRPKSWEAFQI